MLQALDGISFSLKERKRIGGVKRNEKQRETLKGQTGHDVDAAEKKLKRVRDEKRMNK